LIKDLDQDDYDVTVVENYTNLANLNTTSITLSGNAADRTPRNDATSANRCPLKSMLVRTIIINNKKQVSLMFNRTGNLTRLKRVRTAFE